MRNGVLDFRWRLGLRMPCRKFQLALSRIAFGRPSQNISCCANRIEIYQIWADGLMDELLNDRLNGCIVNAPRNAHVRPGTARVQEHPGATVRAKDGGEEPSTARRPACAQERAETAGVTWSARPLEGHESALWERKSKQTVRDILKNHCPTKFAISAPKNLPDAPQKLVKRVKTRFGGVPSQKICL